MKRIIVSSAIVLAAVLIMLSLQGCFTPYPEGAYHRRGDTSATPSHSDLGKP